MVRFNPLVAVFLCFLLSCTSPPQSEGPPPPNVLIILADDQGWGDLGLNGNPVVSTPNIDSLAQSGITLDRFYVCAVCSPTRSEMLTGRYHELSGVYSTSAGGERMNTDETTIADLFQQAGYATGAFGKWHSGMQHPYHPNSRGFDEFYGYCSGHWGSYVDAMVEHNGEWESSEGYLTDVLTEKAMEFISANKDQPFLAYLPLNTPHSPMQVPDRWWNKFKDMPLPEHRYSERESDGKINHTRAAYAMAENIDWNVGRISQHLEDLGLAEHTIIIYFSDNGPNGWRWNGGMEGTKGSVNEGGVRSPCIISYPSGLPAGKTLPNITSVRDLLPTLCEFAGIDPATQHPLNGQSIAPLLLRSTDSLTKRVIVNSWKGNISVRSQGFRLDEHDQLFDMQHDPGQTTDISEEFPEVTNQLLAEKRAHMDLVPVLTAETDPRPFTIGHPDATVTHLPARDALVTGGIQRSNRWPNCSYFTNWTETEEEIYFKVDNAQAATYEVTLYYSCRAEDVGCKVALASGEASTSIEIGKAHDPDDRGMEHDRYERGESYVKDWATISMGTLSLNTGPQTLSLTAPEIPGERAIDFRMVSLRKVD